MSYEIQSLPTLRIIDYAGVIQPGAIMHIFPEK